MLRGDTTPANVGDTQLKYNLHQLEKSAEHFLCSLTPPAPPPRDPPPNPDKS